VIAAPLIAKFAARCSLSADYPGLEIIANRLGCPSGIDALLTFCPHDGRGAENATQALTAPEIGGVVVCALCRECSG
jgi:hypothetical protein